MLNESAAHKQFVEQMGRMTYDDRNNLLHRQIDTTRSLIRRTSAVQRGLQYGDELGNLVREAVPLNDPLRQLPEQPPQNEIEEEKKEEEEEQKGNNDSPVTFDDPNQRISINVPDAP